MLRVVEVLKTVAPRAYPNYVRAFERGDALLAEHGIDRPLRLAHFLAQVLHETGGGTVLFENLRYTTGSRLMQIFGVGNHSAAIREAELPGLLGNEEAIAERVYGLGNPKKAAELGNVRPGDGYRYRGGGVLQTTGGGNYRRMGERAGVDFHADPNLIVDPEHALKPALMEWSDKDVNRIADRDDIRAVTFAINGGYNGIEDRIHWFGMVWAIVGEGEAWKAAQPGDDTRWLQEALNDVGAEPLLLVDGRYGPATTEAVRWFQSVAGLKVDGVAGDVTLAALRQRFQVLRAA